jgi:SPX domain protein involved in polyphosphate accumulation
MKFGEYLRENILPEWADFYINYKTLKALLGPFKKFYQAKISKLTHHISQAKQKPI